MNRLKTLALIILPALAIACQPPIGGAAGDATGAATGANTALSQWMPRVLVIEGTCDASLYVQVGPVLTRVKVDAAAGHDHLGAEAGATIALESALATYSCTYSRGHESGCEHGPGVPIVAPEAPAPPDVDSSSISAPEDASSVQEEADGEVP